MTDGNFLSYKDILGRAGGSSSSSDGFSECPSGDLFAKMGIDGIPKRLGIMGGTFDPIHIGHLICAQTAMREAHLDGVLFMPAGNPSFKQQKTSASAKDRLAMCVAAIDDNPDFGVSDLEIEREGITYTSDTAIALRNFFPENVELVFIVGSDAFLTLPSWHESQIVSGLLSFCVIMRPGDDVESVKRLIAQRSYDATVMEGLSIGISSSYLRELAKDGRSLKYLTRDGVCKYIAENRIYLMISKEAPDGCSK